ncbi:MAG: acetate kinase, partial [Gammaproteobacteria bacterium]|nr:acetate kinase [Gammaproteobacteria bacterium]
SMTAWKEGQVIDTSMGFSPVDGMTMATRSGSLDPMVVLHLLTKGHHTVDSLATLLQRQSGLKGLSGTSGDIRELLKTGSADSKLAIDHFCYQARKQLGAYCFALGGVDTISFGGGIAENQPAIRQRILSDLDQFGISLCPDRNMVAQESQPLHTESSKVALFLNPVDEMAEMVSQFLKIQDS